MQGKTTAKPVLVSLCSGVRERLYICYVRRIYCMDAEAISLRYAK